MNTYELAKITQPTCGSLFKSVMADWLGMACHYFFIFPQQLKVFRQNFSQTRNSFANYSQIRIYGEWRMLSASLASEMSDVSDDFHEHCYIFGHSVPPITNKPGIVSN